MKWTWRDIDEIALDLVEQHPNTDPMSVQLTDLRRMVIELPNFGDDPDASNEKTLEAIQAAWYDEYED